jgi:hypothetical protein
LESAVLESSGLTDQKPRLLPSLSHIGAAELLDTWWNSRSETTNRAYKQDLELFRKWMQEAEGLPVETDEYMLVIKERESP